MKLQLIFVRDFLKLSVSDTPLKWFVTSKILASLTLPGTDGMMVIIRILPATGPAALKDFTRTL
jgi:hypothetical protein